MDGKKLMKENGKDEGWVRSGEKKSISGQVEQKLAVVRFQWYLECFCCLLAPWLQEINICSHARSLMVSFHKFWKRAKFSERLQFQTGANLPQNIQITGRETSNVNDFFSLARPNSANLSGIFRWIGRKMRRALNTAFFYWTLNTAKSPKWPSN